MQHTPLQQDVFYVSVRTFVVQDAPFGNYSVAFFSDWEDKCVTQVSFQWKNPDFLLKNPDFLVKK